MNDGAGEGVLHLLTYDQVEAPRSGGYAKEHFN